MKDRLFVASILLLLFLSSGCIAPEPVVVTDPSVQTQDQNVPDVIHIDVPSEDLNKTTDNILVNDQRSGTLRIGAFNVQVFGVKKASNPEVMALLADIIRTYDIIAIQEVRDSSQTALLQLVDKVNSDGSKYDHVVSERLGRTSSKEQYAYLYNTKTVQLSGTPHTYPEPDGLDPFHREPYIAAFNASGGNFDAVLIVVHTDPDEATQEINALRDVVDHAQRLYPDEGDIILMGDLNADGSYFNEKGQSRLDDYHWLIDNSQDTTTKATNYTYDRIILTDTSDLSGNFGVFRFDLEYGLTEAQTQAVSDHYPVFAEFYVDRDRD